MHRASWFLLVHLGIQVLPEFCCMGNLYLIVNICQASDESDSRALSCKFSSCGLQCSARTYKCICLDGEVRILGSYRSSKPETIDRWLSVRNAQICRHERSKIRRTAFHPSARGIDGASHNEVRCCIDWCCQKQHK